MINKIYAIQLAESIVIKEVDFFLNDKVLFSESNELFLEKSEAQYIYIYKHGVVCFYNIELDEVDKIKKQLLEHTINPSTGLFKKEFEMFSSNNTNYIDQDNIYITEGNTEAIRLVMLNISKAVTLNKYSLEVDNIITDIKKHTGYFEKPEKPYISGKKLKRYIANNLNAKNKILENLSSLEAPEFVSNDELLNKFNFELNKHFDLNDSYSAINELLEIMKVNLGLLNDEMQQKDSSKLELFIVVISIIIFIAVSSIFLIKVL